MIDALHPDPACRLPDCPLPVLSTGRLVLRAPLDIDAPALAAGLSDYAVASMLARVPAPYLLADAVDWLASMTRGRSAEGFAFAVTLDGKAVGVVGFDWRGTDLHVGYWLARSYWGRGIMSEAVSAALSWHFAEEPGGTLVSGVFTDNRASLALQNRLGFAITGLGEVFCQARNRSQSHIETMVDAARFVPVGPPPRVSFGI